MRRAAQRFLTACALLASFGLTASCGQRGPLTLPAGSKAGTIAPAPRAPQAPAQTPPEAAPATGAPASEPQKDGAPPQDGR
jgi:predicted small lipoprotein YifL